MGTSIELCLGNVSLSYSKSHGSIDYGFLFQNSDLTRPLVWINKLQKITKKTSKNKRTWWDRKRVFARTLSRVLPRLEVLGFTLETANTEYQALLKEAEEISQNGNWCGRIERNILHFEEFCNLASLSALPIWKMTILNTIHQIETKFLRVVSTLISIYLIEFLGLKTLILIGLNPVILLQEFAF